ncbi:alpha-soluble NSF attachment protein [Thozetella sp. PMI_491]|nr:alpha-soluble NSF attachment protein [Thozetella sp. PMI_491]
MSQDPRALLQKAEKTTSSASGGFSFFGGRQDKYQDAADLYIQAANAFRLQGLNKEAGAAFEKAAQIQTVNLKEPDDAANTMIDAFKVYRRDDPRAAVRCLEVAIQQYCAKGNFRRAASHKESMGEVFETELGDVKGALESYELAAGWYDTDNAPALANKLYLKVADLAALEADYYKAIGIYEKVAASSISNNLMKYSVKEYFLKAGVCHLATKDMVAVERALAGYREQDPTFASTREHQLLTDLLGAIQAGDQDQFTDKLYAFDQMSKLDKWKTAIFVRIKSQIEEADNEFS